MTLVVVAILTAVPLLAGQLPPAAPTGPSSTQKDTATTTGQDQEAPPLSLPVSLDKIRDALQQPPVEPLKGLNERPQFRVEIRERQKIEELLQGLKFNSGPAVPGGLYAYEQQQVLFPKVDNPLVQPYAAFSQSELAWVSLTSLIERYLAGRVVNAMTAANRDPTQLLDVDVHQFAGPLTLIATNQATARPVQPIESMKLVPAQELVASGAGQPRKRRKPMWAQLSTPTQLQ